MRNILAVCAVLLSVSFLQAQTRSRGLKWDEAATAITARPVIVDLSDGSHVQGVPISVTADALSIDVTANSHKTYKMGQATIPRAQIVGFRVKGVRSAKNHSATGLTIGSAAGTGAGWTIINAGKTSVFFENLYDASHIAGGVSVMVAAPVAGYFIGRHFDQQRTERILVLPD